MNKTVIPNLAETFHSASKEEQVDAYVTWLQSADPFEAIATFLLGRMQALSMELENMYKIIRKGKTLPEVKDQESAEKRVSLLGALASVLKETKSDSSLNKRRYLALHTDFKVFKVLLEKLSAYAEQQFPTENNNNNNENNNEESGPVSPAIVEPPAEHLPESATTTSTETETSIPETQQCQTTSLPADTAAEPVDGGSVETRRSLRSRSRKQH